jgi:Domain of unknown function (DUF5060)
MIRWAVLSAVLLSPASWAAPTDVSFSQPARSVEAYDFLEVTANVAGADAANLFLDATLRGSFTKTDGAGAMDVEGFWDSKDGSVFRIRFMPSRRAFTPTPLSTAKAVSRKPTLAHFVRLTAIGGVHYNQRGRMDSA